MLGDDLREDRAVSLSTRRRAKVRMHVAIGLDANCRRLWLLDAGRLHTTRHADPDALARSLPLARGLVANRLRGRWTTDADSRRRRRPPAEFPYADSRWCTA